MSSCAVETAKGWAIGLLAGAATIAIIALSIGAVLRLTYHDPHRVCAKGHDGVDSTYQSTYFICDLWVPDTQPTPRSTP